MKMLTGKVIEAESANSVTDVYVESLVNGELLGVVTVNGIRRFTPGQIVTAYGRETVVPEYERFTYIECEPCDIRVNRSIR